MDHILQPPVGYVVAKASHLQNKGEQWQGEESLTRKSEGGISQVELSVCVCVCVCTCAPGEFSLVLAPLIFFALPFISFLCVLAIYFPENMIKTLPFY